MLALQAARQGAKLGWHENRRNTWLPHVSSARGFQSTFCKSILRASPSPAMSLTSQLPNTSSELFLCL